MSALRPAEIRPLGDSAIVVQLAEPGATEPLIREVLHAQRVLEAAEIPGVVEITTAFTTVTIFYDPLRVPGGAASMFASLEERIRSALSAAGSVERASSAEGRAVDIPVCCAPEFALDVAEIAQHCAMEPREVVRLYVSAEYRVGCIGFTPGFPYLVGLPAALVTPRRATPRTNVPAGSVAIGGNQAGIYPLQSPGGWNVIGRTPLRLFDVTRETPGLLRAGDCVRFREISLEEFEAESARDGHAGVQVAANK
jgi:inhibitor of KinA